MISDIRSLRKPWQRLLPFQSWGQLAGYLAAAGIGTLVVAGILWAAGARVAPVVVLACFAGAVPVLYASLPATSEIAVPATDREWKARVVDMAARIGYPRMAEAGQVTTCTTAWPRWLAWRENRITIGVQPASIVVRGPAFAIGLLHGRLRKVAGDRGRA